MESWNRIVAATFIAIALMQIFGNGGLLITLSLILLGLFLVYFFQNSLLYMPGIISLNQISQTLLTVPKITPKATATLPNTTCIANKSASPPPTTSTSKVGS